MWRSSYWLLWQGQRLLLVSYGGLAVRQVRGDTGRGPEDWTLGHGLFLGLGCQHCGREEPWVEVMEGEDGSYQATLCGPSASTSRIPEAKGIPSGTPITTR